MFCKGTRGLIMGTLIGAAAGMIILPQLDRKTQRCMKKAGRKLVCAAEDTYDTITSVMK